MNKEIKPTLELHISLDLSDIFGFLQNLSGPHNIFWFPSCLPSASGTAELYNNRWKSFSRVNLLFPGRCDLYGDPHYISFQGVPFDFLDECTYVLVEEQSPRHNLTIAVDNFYCFPGLEGSCVKGLILKYQGNVATLDISPSSATVQVQPSLCRDSLNPTYPSKSTVCHPLPLGHTEQPDHPATVWGGRLEIRDHWAHRVHSPPGHPLLRLPQPVVDAGGQSGHGAFP